MNLFKNFDRDVALSWVYAILIGAGLAFLLQMVLPANSPYLWIKWMTLPVMYGAQKLILSEMKNPTKFEGQE